MFENNQAKYDQVKNAVQTHWNVTDEEFSRTRGEVDELVRLISSKTGLSDDLVLQQLQDSVYNSDNDVDKPAGIVNSESKESKEWQAREDQQNY